MTFYFFSSKGALVDFVYKDPHFTAYRSASILDVNSLIGKLFYNIILNDIKCLIIILL